MIWWGIKCKGDRTRETGYDFKGYGWETSN